MVGTGLALGLGALGAVGGAIAGGSDQESTSYRNVAPPGTKERELQEASFQNFLAQQNLVQQQEADIAGAKPLQDQARGSLSGIFSGQQFAATPEEEMRINNYRQALIEQGSADVQNAMLPLYQRANASAADRGVRGQALSQLQGDVLRAGAEQMGALTRQANVTAQQQLMDNPYRRAALQGQLGSQNANFMEALRQQAISNRQALQNPALMQNLQNERMGTASTTTVQPGSFGGALGGALGGFGSVMGGVGAINNAFPGAGAAGFRNDMASAGLPSSNSFTMPTMGSQFGRPV